MRRSVSPLGTVRGRPAGQSIVELSVLLPVLLLTTIGVFEFGRAIHATIAVTHAAREAARVAMDYDLSVAAIKARAITAADPLALTTSDVLVSGPRAPGTDTSVKITYRFASSVPLISEIWGGDLVITRTAVSRTDEL